MKNSLILICTFMSTILFGQNNMNEHLKKLFLDLDLTQNPKEMVMKSKLSFEYGTNRTINWGNSGKNISDYVASFERNPLIESKIKNGVVTIIPKNSSTQNKAFSINERVWFYNLEDMVKEFVKICFMFEKSGSKVKNTIIQNDNFETISENAEITIDSNHKLIISYYLSNEKDKEYSIAFMYDN